MVERPEEIVALEGGQEVDVSLLRRSGRWTGLFGGKSDDRTRGTMRLGAIARVHRGVVTGCNDFFLLSRTKADELGVGRWCRPAIIAAHEILQSDGVICDTPDRSLLLDVPCDVDRHAHPELDAYLRQGEEANGAGIPVAQRYIPAHRHPWWYLGPQQTPPIVASYMARQPPRFAANPDGLAIVNVAHGIYPHWRMTSQQLAALVAALNQVRGSFRGSGRPYHGGLEKFEPREMEALRIPKGDWI